MKNICIYHKSCADGFGAALAVKKHFDRLGQKCKYVAANYGDNPPKVDGMNVVIVDFSFPKDVLIKMENVAASIIVLDHHKTAEENLKGLKFCSFDMKRSGAMIAWNHFHGDDAPMLIQYIQDRDLWKWELPNSEAVSAAIKMLPMDFSDWDRYLDDVHIKELISKGAVILEYQEQQVLRALDPSKIRMVEIEGYEVPMANTTTLVSEICGRMAENQPFAITYFDTPEDRVYSLRSRGNNACDVSLIAKSFGGGGHRNAAGFSIPLTETQL